MGQRRFLGFFGGSAANVAAAINDVASIHVSASSNALRLASAPFGPRMRDTIDIDTPSASASRIRWMVPGLRRSSSVSIVPRTIPRWLGAGNLSFIGTLIGPRLYSASASNLGGCNPCHHRRIVKPARDDFSRNVFKHSLPPILNRAAPHGSQGRAAIQSARVPTLFSVPAGRSPKRLPGLKGLPFHSCDAIPGTLKSVVFHVFTSSTVQP